MSDEHLPYLWAGCRRGAFVDETDFNSEMSPQEFHDMLARNVTVLERHGGRVWVVMKGIPIGIGSVSPMFRYVQPHVTWLPEATSRDRLEGCISFLNELKQETPFLITCKMAYRTFFDHLCKYGLIRSVGRLKSYYGKGEHAMLFQSVE